MRSRCNDIEVAWHEAGRGDPLIIIHGLEDDHRAWRRALPDLMLHHRVLMYELRGHGETSLGAANGTLRQLGDDLVALLDAVVFFSSRRRHTRFDCDWSSDVCSSD